jgi:hypothetical protein
LNFLIIFNKGILIRESYILHFALGPVNYVCSPAMTSKSTLLDATMKSVFATRAFEILLCKNKTKQKKIQGSGFGIK